MAQVIHRSNTNPWGQAFGIIGQGLNGFTKGAMAAKQLDMQQKMIDMFGKNGGGIMTPGVGTAQTPAAGGTASPTPTTTTILPSTPANAGGAGTSYAGLSSDDIQKLLNQTLGWTQGA